MGHLWWKSVYLLMKRQVAVLLMALLLVIGCSAGGFADVNKRYAKITDINGVVMLMKNGGEREFKAFNGMSLSEGDRIKTGIASSVTLQIDDTKVVKVADNTTLDVSDLKGALEKGNDQTSMQLWGGKVVVSINKKLGNDEKFNIKTPTAIMGVRGTLFFVGQDMGNTDLAVLEGAVAASSYRPVDNRDSSDSSEQQGTSQPTEVMVGANQQVSLTGGQGLNQVVKKDIVTAESLDLLALQAIQQEPQRVNPELLRGIEDLIQRKQLEQDQMNQKLLETQQQQQQQLQQQTPLGQALQPEIIFAPEPPPAVPGTPNNPVVSDLPTSPPTPSEPSITVGTTGNNTTSSDHDHSTTVTLPQSATLTPSGYTPTMSTYKQSLSFTVTPSDATVNVTLSDATPENTADDPLSMTTSTSPSYAGASVFLTATGNRYDVTATLHVSVSKEGYTTTTQDFPILVTASASELANLHKVSSASAFEAYVQSSDYWPVVLANQDASHTFYPDNGSAYYYWLNAYPALDYTTTAATLKNDILYAANMSVTAITNYTSSATPLTAEMLKNAGANPAIVNNSKLQQYSDVLADSNTTSVKSNAMGINQVVIFVNDLANYVAPTFADASAATPTFMLSQYMTWGTQYEIASFPDAAYPALSGNPGDALYTSPGSPVQITTLTRPPGVAQALITVKIYLSPGGYYNAKVYLLQLPNNGNATLTFQP